MGLCFWKILSDHTNFWCPFRRVQVKYHELTQGKCNATGSRRYTVSRGLQYLCDNKPTECRSKSLVHSRQSTKIARASSQAVVVVRMPSEVSSVIMYLQRFPSSMYVEGPASSLDYTGKAVLQEDVDTDRNS